MHKGCPYIAAKAILPEEIISKQEKLYPELNTNKVHQFSKKAKNYDLYTQLGAASTPTNKTMLPQNHTCLFSEVVSKRCHSLKTNFEGATLKVHTFVHGHLKTL